MKGQFRLLLCFAAALSSVMTPAVFSGRAMAAEDEHCTTAPENEKILGTSRRIEFGTQGGPAIGFKSYPQSLPLNDHEVVLTFDDGPWPGTTPAILSALAAQCVKATFFLIGRNANAAPALVRREIAEGHTIAHHSFSHPSVTMRGLDEAKARIDIDKGFAAVDTAAYGKAEKEPRIKFFRYPGFADTPSLNAWLGERNIAIFGTDLWASDWLKMTPDEEEKLLLTRLEKQGRGIILLHDTKQATAAMLPKFLEDLHERGYRIVHVIPGSGSAETVPAPPGWTSETEAILKQRQYLPKPPTEKKPKATKGSSASHRPARKAVLRLSLRDQDILRRSALF